MKSLVENSISINIPGRSPAIKTIFNLSKEEDRNSQKYLNLSTIPGETLRVSYKFTEEDLTKKGLVSIIIPEGLDELGVKNLVLAEITQTLSE